MLARDPVRDLPEKLRLTAALLGCDTQKALCAAFRRVNPGTAFDLDRSYKWMQGRTLPRSARVYADWAVLLDASRPAAWVAGSALGDFLDAVCRRHGRDPRELLRSAGLDAAAPAADVAAGHLGGAYALYAPALPPSPADRLSRASLRISASPRRAREMVARFAQSTAAGPASFRGPVLLFGGAVHLHLRPEAPRDAAPPCFHLWPVAPPGGLLVGIGCGTLGSGPGHRPPFARRVVLLRVPDAAPLEAGNRDLGPADTPSGDLAALGLRQDDPAELDARVRALLRPGAAGRDGGGGDGAGWDVVAADEQAALADAFGRWRA